MAKSSIKSKLLNQLRPLVLQANQKLGNYQDVIWLIGSGRSGTTWVSSMLNYKRGYREMIEPFRPHLIDEVNFLRLNQYVRPGSSFPDLDEIATQVFSGKFTHSDVDSASKSLTYRGLMIKDVFANLFAYRLCEQFKEVKPALLIRNPYQVALSKHKKKDWNWTTDPRDFFFQDDLMKDHLDPFIDLIQRIGEGNDPILKHLVVWCIINYVPLKQFREKDLYVLFYEDMVNDANQEVDRFWKTMKPNKAASIHISNDVLIQPSSVSQELKKNVEREQDWRAGITETQMELGNEILKEFGFESLYQNGQPRYDVIQHLMRN